MEYLPKLLLEEIPLLDVYHKYRTLLYPGLTEEQLLFSLHKDLQNVADSQSKAAPTAMRMLKNWKQFVKGLRNDTKEHTYDTNPTFNTSLVQNTGPITVSGDLLQGAVYNAEKRGLQSEPESTSSKKQRATDPGTDSIPPLAPSLQSFSSSTIAPENVFHDDASYGPVHMDDASNASDTSKEISSLWEEWMDFMRAAAGDENLTPYCPEKHGIVICGKHITSRKGMPQSYPAMNDRLQETIMKRSVFKDILSEDVKKYISNIMDQESVPKMLRAARQIPSNIPTNHEQQYYYLADIYTTIIRDIWLCKADLKYETTLNTVAVFPAAKISILDYDKATDVLEFLPGEVFLESMARQLDQAVQYDETVSGYKADGVIRIKEPKSLEIVLFETSGGLSKGSQKKKTFDFHKGMFGMVAMLKTLADTFKYGSMDALKAVNLYFVHTHGVHIRLWCFSVLAPGVFTMNRVDKCTIPVTPDDEHAMLGYVRMFWDLKIRIKETITAIYNLQQTHLTNMKNSRFQDIPQGSTLSYLINPTIVKLTERKDSRRYSTDDCPRSSPPIPDFY